MGLRVYLPPGGDSLKESGGLSQQADAKLEGDTQAHPWVANWYHSVAAAIVKTIIFVTPGFPSRRAVGRCYQAAGRSLDFPGSAPMLRQCSLICNSIKAVACFIPKLCAL